MAIETQGAKVFWSASTSLSTNVQVVGVTGWNGPTGSAAVIDITAVSDTAGKQKLMGLRDEGQITLDINYQATAASHIAILTDRAARNKRNLAIYFNDGNTSLMHMKCYPTGFAITGAVDQAVKASVTFEITGAVTHTTA